MASTPTFVSFYGTEGTPLGGVATIQGAGAGAVPVNVNVAAIVGIAAQIEGTAANGAVPVGNPVWTGGWDGVDVRAFLTDASGRQVAVGAGAAGAAVAGNPVLVAGSDGANTRTLLTAATGRLSVDINSITGGSITANQGTPAVVANSWPVEVTDGTNVLGVLAHPIRVDPTGTTTQPVSGTVTATNASIGVNAAAAPASSTQVGGSDGTNLQAARAFDLDTGAGTEYNLGVSLRLPGAGASVAGGTTTNPFNNNVAQIAGTATVTAGTAGLQAVGGPAAEAAAASGNPLRVAGWDGTNVRTLKTDASGNLSINVAATGASAGEIQGNTAEAAVIVSQKPVRIAGWDGSNLWTLRCLAPADGSTFGGANPVLQTYAQGYGYNESTYDRWRNNTSQTALASAARTASANSGDLTNYNGRGVNAVLDISAASGTGGLQLLIQGKDSISSNYYQLNGTPTAIVAVSTSAYEVYPGGGTGTVGNVTRVAGVVPRTFRIRVLAGDSTSYTYSVSVNLVL